jgi:hypothetical protein
MNLDDFIIPENPRFKLSSTGKEYELDLVTIGHLAYFRSVVGGGLDKIQAFLESLPFDEGARLVYRLLKDKSDFLASEQEVIDDDGMKVKKIITGPEKFMLSVRLEEVPGVMGALMRSVELSMPKAGELMRKMLDDAKKKRKEMKDTKSPTGSSSTTPSPVNTVLQ